MSKNVKNKKSGIQKEIEMDIFGVLTLIGGLALFLYGMNVMGNGLEKLAGGKLERYLKGSPQTLSRQCCLDFL